MSSITKWEDWHGQAACIGEMGAIFYPPMRPERRSVKNAREQRAKAVCEGCSVREECLDYALENNERYGIWGGLTDAERRDLRPI